MTDINKRPDIENWRTLIEHGDYVNYGTSLVKLLFVKKALAGWEEVETKRGHKAPLKNIPKAVED